MNTFVKAGVAGVLVIGGAVAANASSFTSPSSGSSDLILFAEVINGSGATVASYAGDTGISVASAFGGATTQSNVLGSDANLGKLFAADASGDTVIWGVQAGAYTTVSPTVSTFGVPGAAKFITTTADGTGNLSTVTTGNLVQWSGLNTDVQQVAMNAAGASSVEGASAATAGVWDYANNAGTISWYGNGPVTENSENATVALYSVTGNGTKTTKLVSYAQIGTVDLTAAGLQITGSSTSPVPLPAAVWLLGSGLLGLFGVGRRRTAKA